MNTTSAAKQGKNGFDLRLYLSALVLFALALFFWTSSRYPALNEKALMGGDTPLSGLSFDIILDIFPDSPIWWEITANMVNWVVTNWKGMTFGVLFAAAILTLLSVVKKKSFENGFANAALGAVIGAPLGVCVNCAAPIALGLHMGRMRLETTLAALMASPTLNVIVVTMSFALLPVHVAATKLLLALVMVLLLVPLLCKYWLKAETAASGSDMANLTKVSEPKGLSGWIAKALTPQEYEEHNGGTSSALIWYVRVFARNLFYIAIITVPMMFVAGFLGALVATWFDSGALVNTLPIKGFAPILLAMIAIAAIATFAPAPIALDIILTAVLLGVGLRTDYAAVVLISLGMFSVYAFIILWRAISLKTALTIWAATMALAVAGGVIANLTERYETAYFEARAVDYLTHAPAITVPVPPALPAAQPWTTLQPQIMAQTIDLAPLAVTASSDRASVITISRFVSNPVGAPAAGGDAVFARVPGQHIGLDEQGIIHPYREMGPEMLSGAIAAGDIHGDGWVDVVTKRPTGAAGLSLYANIGGRFARQQLDLGPVADMAIVNVALVDMDNDARLDLVAATRADGVFVFFNQSGTFSQSSMSQIALERYGLAMSMAFADMDRDGDLDIIIGRWAHGSGREGWHPVIPDVATNQMVWNSGGGEFVLDDLPGSAGQTLTMLVSDFDGDGIADLLKGDDVAFTDQIIRFSPQGKPLPITRDDQIFPYLMRTSMSYDVGDWNNDLRRDYYGGQIASETEVARDSSMGDGRIFEICQQFGRDNRWTLPQIRSCAAELKSIDKIRGGKTAILNANCGSGQNARDTKLCFGLEYLHFLRRKMDKGPVLTQPKAIAQCRKTLAGIAYFDDICDAFLLSRQRARTREDLASDHGPAINKQNILLTASANGEYQEEARKRGLAFPGWSWNSRFVDLDQNGWQDILVMTGIWIVPSRAETNIFYHNQGGQFTNATADFGFTDIVPSYSYVSFDYDRDGDIDVIRDISASRMIVHRNDRPAGKALWVHLRDAKGNSMGIGSAVTICTDGATTVQPGKCQMRDIKASGGFQSFDPVAAHFGLGQTGAVSLIQVRWPDGETTMLRPDTELSAGEVVIARR